MYDFFNDPEFVKAHKAGNHYYWDNIDELPTITWDDVIGEVNRSYLAGDPFKTTDHFGMVTHYVHNLPGVSGLVQAFADTNPNKYDPKHWLSAHMYISMTQASATFGRHKDMAEVFFFQAIGSTKWTIEDGGEHVYTLTPKSAVYIPVSMWHTVEPLSPRVGISLGINHFEELPDEEKDLVVYAN
jgi:mannose-6-phosphate isomerase-like protein (cupin superfamily)